MLGAILPVRNALDAWRRALQTKAREPETTGAQALHHQLHRRNIYSGFPLRRYSLDLQGWNSTSPVFRQLLEDIRPQRVVELGTWKGASAIHMCDVARELGLSPFALVCVDTWLGGAWHWLHADEPDGFQSLACRHGFPTLYAQFLANVLHSGHENRIVPLPNTTSAGAAILRELGFIDVDLLYVDAGHSQEAVHGDLQTWWPMVRSGGVLFGDDFSPHYPGVESAVRQFSEERGVAFEAASEKWIIRKP